MQPLSERTPYRGTLSNPLISLTLTRLTFEGEYIDTLAECKYQNGNTISYGGAAGEQIAYLYDLDPLIFRIPVTTAIRETSL